MLVEPAALLIVKGPVLSAWMVDSGFSEIAVGIMSSRPHAILFISRHAIDLLLSNSFVCGQLLQVSLIASTNVCMFLE